MGGEIKWVAISGEGAFDNQSVTYIGNEPREVNGQLIYSTGTFVSDRYFGGGTIRGKIRFNQVDHVHAAGLILHFHPQTQGFLEVQIGGNWACSIHLWGGKSWETYAFAGSFSQLIPNRDYLLEVHVIGSIVRVHLDGVHALETTLPFALPYGQAGFWASGATNIELTHFEVVAEKPRLFVVMQFSAPFDDLYKDVIAPIANELGFRVIRADEMAGPGFVVADIERQLIEAKAVVADITPSNPNVYWEVGYAHALRKPVVLLAERDTKLPFDVSPFRILFYDNTISGKKDFEAGLLLHLSAILNANPSGD